MALRALATEATADSQAKVDRLEEDLRNLRGNERGGRRDRGDFDSRLGKPPSFDGNESKWEEWYFKFRAYLLCNGGVWPQLVTAAEGASADIALDLMDEDHAHGARQLYMSLVFTTEDSALRLVQSVEDSNGCMALRKIINRFAPVTKGEFLPR